MNKVNFDFITSEFLGECFFPQYKLTSRRSIISRFRKYMVNDMRSFVLFYLVNLEFAQSTGITGIRLEKGEESNTIKVFTSKFCLSFRFNDLKERNLFGYTLRPESVSMHMSPTGFNPDTRTPYNDVELKDVKAMILKYCGYPNGFMDGDKPEEIQQPQEPEAIQQQAAVKKKVDKVCKVAGKGNPKPKQIRELIRESVVNEKQDVSNETSLEDVPTYPILKIRRTDENAGKISTYPKLGKNETLILNSRFCTLRKAHFSNWSKDSCTCNRQHVMNNPNDSNRWCDYCFNLSILD